MWEIDPESISTNPEDGTQRCVAVNKVTGEEQVFAHERAFEDAQSFCYWGSKTSDELHEYQKPYGIDWQVEQAQRRGEIAEDEYPRHLYDRPAQAALVDDDCPPF